jgi:hypothetical protein
VSFTQTGEDEFRRLGKFGQGSGARGSDFGEPRAGTGVIDFEGDRDSSPLVTQLPKSKVNINRKMRNKVIPTMNRGEEIILMESGVFPAIYFKKSSICPTQPPCATS